MNDLKLRPDKSTEKEWEKMRDTLQSMWKHLDELHANDPAEYETYVKKVMKENADSIKPPQIDFTVRTNMIKTDSPLYINICSWSVITSPTSDQSSLPMRPGCLRHYDWGSVIDTAVNTSVIKRCRSDKEAREQLIELLIEHIETLSGITLSRHSHLENEPKGGYDKKRLEESLTKGFSVEGTIGSKSVINQLSSIVRSECDAKALSQEEVSQEKRVLIEEVLTEPQYDVRIKKGEKRSVEVRFELPGAESIKDIELDVSEVKNQK